MSGENLGGAPGPRPRGRLWGVALAVGALVVVAAGFALWTLLRPAPYEFASQPLSNLTTAQDFTLESASGPVTLSSLDGKVVLLFFGYTHCPDVCPTEMMQLAHIYGLLDPKDRERVQVAMISVDPARDDAAVMQTYAHAFSPAFLGLTGTPDRIAAVAKQYWVSYQKYDQTAPNVYFVRHTASVYVLNPQRQLELIYNSDDLQNRQQHIADDLHHLLLRGS